MFLEGTLFEKLRKLEALHAGTQVDGEREAAKRAAERIRARLAELRAQEKEVVLVYRLSDPWTRRLFALVATQPVDGRKGADSLMVIVRDVFGYGPFAGHLFVFFSKRCDRVRIVYWDRNVQPSS